MKIAVLDDYQGVALEMADWTILPADAEVTVFRDNLAPIDAVSERLSDFEIIATMRERTPFRRDLLEKLPNLRLLITTGMHNAAIDLEAATELGIVVSGTNGGPNSTAELAWGLILSILRRIPQEDAATRQGKWETSVGTTLYGRVLGVLGLGRLGSQMATIGTAFGMSVIAWSQNLTAERAAEFGATLVTKDELFAKSDIVTIHLKLSDRTRGLVGDRELGLMRPDAYIINTSRGPIIDETALVNVLQKNAIAGAGLDVFDHEPLPPAHPFLSLDNVVLTPHLGYVTKETYEVFHQETVDDIKTFIEGKPERVMNPAVLDAANRR